VAGRIGPVPTPHWESVLTSGCEVPEGYALDDLAIQLTTMLGDTNPEIRDGIAYPVLATWITRGVFDPLLAGLGDGMVAGLTVGLGESGTDSVFRRSFSALILAECVRRDNQQGLVPPETMLSWGDAVSSWIVRERDLRGFVPEKGWAHAIAHGADALRFIAQCLYFGVNELTVILDVIGDRVLSPVEAVWVDGEVDRFASATLALWSRDVVPTKVIIPWINRIAAACTVRDDGESSPFLRTAHPEGFLRALFLQVEFHKDTPQREVLLPILRQALRDANPHTLA
jgi:Protein of unknown function (DUF2785)